MSFPTQAESQSESTSIVIAQDKRTTCEFQATGALDRCKSETKLDNMTDKRI